MRLSSAILIAVFCCASIIPLPAQSISPGVTPMNSADLRIALAKLRVTGTVMYIAAHPDDENSALLAYFAKGKKYRTVYLSLTRGEGGQNILGAEKGADLGIIRTQELLDARRVDGAEQMFSRAIDFGFSKSSGETIRNWGEKETIGDIVWAIRKVRPDIIITRFSPTEGGHGNHTASAILAERAYALSGDRTAYPEQLTYVTPWKAKRLFFNRLSWGAAATVAHPEDLHVDVGEYNPVLGLSYTEIAGISRSMHKTQAMGSEQRRGKSDASFVLTATDSAAMRQRSASSALKNGSEGDLFSGIETSWNRYAGGAAIDKLLAQAERNLEAEHPERILPLLLRVKTQLAALAASGQSSTDPVIAQKRDELTAVIATCAGLHCRALSAQTRVTAGETLPLKLEIIAQGEVPVKIRSVQSRFLGIDSTLTEPMQPDVKQEVNVIASVPVSMEPSRPYWLRTTGTHETEALYRYSIPSLEYTGMPVNPDSLQLVCEVTILGEPITVRLPVRSRVIDPVEGELYKAVTVVPGLDISFTNQMQVWTHPEAKQISVHMHANADTDSGEVRLRGANGANGFKPAAIALPRMKSGEERDVTFSFSPDAAHPLAVIDAEAQTGSGRNRFTMQTAQIAYPHIMTQQVMREAQLLAVQADIVTVKRKIGYVAG
ncbi:MAG TPA: PIG-L family deacetylase, partial [Bacteroidota bacterium]|nr:PIG-L family deacetylase [Bacteroidota bacterium]